jgi:hypothetical protein
LIIASGNCVSIAWKMDSGVFVPRIWHVIAGMFFLGAMHLMFNANPMYTSAMLKEKEDAKAKKGK